MSPSGVSHATHPLSVANSISNIGKITYIAQFVKDLMPTIGDGARQSGKDLAKNRVGEVGCDPLFVISRFLEGSLMKGPAIAR